MFHVDLPLHFEKKLEPKIQTYNDLIERAIERIEKTIMRANERFLPLLELHSIY